MADGANLELNISASQDASVHQTFTTLVKLLEKLNKRLGSLNSSIEKLVGDNTKLKKSNKAVADSAKQVGDQVEKTAKKVSKATDDTTRATIRQAGSVGAATEALKENAKAAEEAAKEQEKLAKSTDKAQKAQKKILGQSFVTSKTYMLNTNVPDRFNDKLAEINKTVKAGTKEFDLQTEALNRTEAAWKKHLKRIDDSVARRASIEATIVKMENDRANGTPVDNLALADLQRKAAELASLTNETAFMERVSSFDYDKEFQHNLAKLQPKEPVTITEKHRKELERYGNYALEIYDRVTEGMEDNALQRAHALRDIRKYGETYEKQLRTLKADISTAYSNFYAAPDQAAKDYWYDQIQLSKQARDSLIENTTSMGSALRSFMASQSSIKDAKFPETKLDKYTKEIKKHGNEAVSLFNTLNVGLDENSAHIEYNAKSVAKFMQERRKEIADAEAELLAFQKLQATASNDEELNRALVGLTEAEKKVAAAKRKISAEGIWDAFIGDKSGRDRAFKGLDDVVKGIEWAEKRLENIKSTTVTGSHEQSKAIQGLRKDVIQYNKTLEITSSLVNIAGDELDKLKKNNADISLIEKQERVVREVAKIRKMVDNTYSGISDAGTSSNINRILKKYSSLLQSDTPFGAQARSLFADADFTKLNDLSSRLGQINKQYKNVIPTIERFRDVHRLTSEQYAQLTSADFMYRASLEKTTTGVRKLAEEQLGFHKTSRTSINLFDRMASSMGNMARYAFASSIYYAFTNAVYATVDAVAKFDQSLKNLQAITDATDNEVAALGEEIKRVAVETRYGINEVADGATIIGQAGYSATETMSILGSAMNLAQGSMSTVTASADLLTTVLASFNLQASDAAMVADNMAAAMNYSKLDIDKLRTAFNYVGPVAMDAGASLQEMSAILMVLANNGMKASTIGTSLRNVFSQLQSPSVALRKALMATADGEKTMELLASKTVPVAEKFKALNTALGTNNNLFKLFGLRAAGTVSILTKYYTQIEEMEQGLYTLGESERMADKQMEGLANRFANLRASMEVLGVTISEQPSKALSDFVLLITKGIQSLTSLLDGPLGAAIVSFGTLAGAMGTAVAAGRLFNALFGVKLFTAIKTANTAIAMGVHSIGMLATTSAGATGALTGLANVFLGFSTAHPILALLTAITVAVGAMWGAWKLFWEEDDKATTVFQQNMKKRRDEIGLLRTALEYNEKITDSDKRARNNVYVASKLPDVSEPLLNARTKEGTRDILSARLAQAEADLVTSSVTQAEHAVGRLNGLYKKRDELLSRYQTIKPAPKFDDPQLQEEYTRLHGDVAVKQEQLGEQLTKTNKDITHALGDAGVAFSGILENTSKTAQAYVADGMDALHAWEWAVVDTTKNIVWKSEDAKKRFQDAVLSEKIGFLGKNNVAIAGDGINNLQDRLNAIGLEGEIIVNTYKDLGHIEFNTLIRELEKAEKAYKRITTTLTGEEQQRALVALVKDTNAKLIKGSVQTAEAEMQWSEKVRQKKIADINAAALTQEQKAIEINKVNKEAYEQQLKDAEALLKTQVRQIVDINKLGESTDIDATVNLLLAGDYNKLDNHLWQLLLNGGITRTIDVVWKLRGDVAKTANFDPVPSYKAAKKDFDAAKNLYDEDIANIQRKYDVGAISDTSYVAQKIAATDRLIEREQAYVDLLNDAISIESAEVDYARYLAAYTALEERKAKAAHEKEMLSIEQARYEAEKSHNKAMFNIDAEAAALENRDMNESDRQTGLLKLEGKRIQANIDYINKQLESKDIKNNEKKQTELQLDLEKQKLELQKNQVAQERLAYEIRTKYIEQEYKYGLASKEDYQQYIQKQMAEGKLDPYEGQRKLWITSGNPYDGVKEGLARIMDETKDMNEWIAEGVANFRDEWHSAIDDFVDACWDGTKSAEEIFKDFATNILMDWQKRIIKMYSDQMFDELIAPFLKGEGLGNIFNTLGGGRTPAIDTTATPIQSSTVTPNVSVDTSGLQLSLNSTLQNVQANVSAATAAQTASVEGMATQSTSLLTTMTNGATNLWSFLGNGFSSLWDMIGSGMSNMIFMITSSLTSGAGSGKMSFLERWLTNSIGMGFKLIGSYSGGGSGGSGGSGGYDFASKGGVGNSLQLSDSFKGISDIAKNGIKFAKGGAFKGLSEFSNSIVSSPTLFTYGEHLKAFAKGGVMGEAGPEAIMPLTRDSNGRLGVSAEGMGGAQCINNIYIETPEGYTAEQTSRVSNNNGGEDIMFTIVKQTAANVAQPGSPMYRAMQNTFGASQVLTSR